MGKEPKGDGDLGAQLRELRLQRGLSLSNVAKAVNYDESSISRFERGLEPIPPDYLERFCQLLGVRRDLLEKGDLSKGALKVGAASYSDYMFFAMVCQAPAFSACIDEHLPPLEVDIKPVAFDEIPQLLKSGELHVSLYWQEKAVTILSQHDFAGSIVQLPAIYSIQSNPILAFSPPHHPSLQTFGQLFLQNRCRGRDMRILSTLRQCLVQLTRVKDVQFFLPAGSDRSAMIIKLLEIALETPPLPIGEEQKDLRRVLTKVRDLAGGSESKDRSLNRQLNEPAAFHEFVRASKSGDKPGIFSGGLAHRLMAEGWPGVGPLIGNFALQMLTNVVQGHSTYFFPQYCLLVNKHIWETRKQHLRTLATRWNMVVQHVHADTLNFRWVNEYIDHSMAKAHDLRKEWLKAEGFKETAKDPLVNWQSGHRLFETMLRENLIQLRRWNWETG